MSDIDPDVQAAFGGPAPAVSTPGTLPSVDDDVAAAFSGSDWSERPKTAAETATVGQRALGAGEAILHAGSGVAGALGGGIAYLGVLGSPHPEVASDVQRGVQEALTYEPRTPVGKQYSSGSGSTLPDWASKAGQGTSDALTKLGVPAPIAAGTGAAVNTGVNAIPMVVPRGAPGAGARLDGPTVDLGGPHPLAAAAKAETARLAQIKDTGAGAGLDLPEGGTPARHAQAATNNRPVVNAMARDELNLPPNAPLTPNLLNKARETYASPAYETIKAIPKIELGPDYHADIAGLDENPAEFSPKLKPPEGDSMTGADAVDRSKKMRYRANQYDRQASISGSPEASDLADLHRTAAEAIEDAVRDHLNGVGQPELAQNWDDARTYTAKTYSVQNALDGAGNVKATALKQQLLKNRPLSGNLEVVANLAAQYPQAFKLTQEAAPQAGLVRRAAAAVAPGLATAGGGAIGSIFGPGGAAAGAMGGRVVGENIANRIVPQ
jgi:hypothetical protein